MAPPAEPAGHRPIQSFFRGGHEPCSTSTALPEATAPAPAAPPAAASVPADASPRGSAERPPTSRARQAPTRREGGDAASAGATFSSNCDAKRPRVSADRNRAEEDADADRGEGLPGPSPSASSAMDEPKRWTNRSGRVPVPVGGNALPKKTKQTKQLFLDLGQKSFGHVTCPRCGLLYARCARGRPHARAYTPRTSRGGPAPSDEFRMFRRRPGPRSAALGVESAAWHSRRERVMRLRSPGPREAARGGA